MTTASNPSLSIVIPAYNEERRLPATIRDLRSFFERFGNVEVIIVIEKSTDRTVEVAREAAGDNSFIRIVANDAQRGKGFAVKTGMLLARGEVVFFMDADLSTPLAEVLSFLAEFAASPDIDVLIGSRAEAKSQIIKKQTWVRRNLGRGFNRFVQVFGVSGIKDTQCGFKAFRKRAVEPIFSRLTINGFAFDVELLVLAQLMGLGIKTVPVRWINSPDSKVRIWIDPLKMLVDLVRIKRLARQTLKARPFVPSSST